MSDIIRIFNSFCLISRPNSVVLFINDEVESTRCEEAFTIKFYGLT